MGEGDIDYSDDELLLGIRSKNERIIGHILEKYRQVVSGMVLAKGGKREDARYVLEETIVVIYSKGERIELTSSFRTFFVGVAKNVWFSEWRRRLRIPSHEPLEEGDAVDYMPDYDARAERKRLVLRYYNMMPENCRELLRMMAFGYSNEEIMTTMAYSSIQYTKNRKSACLKMLIRLMQKDPLFNELQMVE